MKCHFHPEIDGLSECRLCGRPLCASCAVEIQGAPYCRECLQSRIEQPVASSLARVPTGGPSPKVAGWLSLLPGLGLVYLGEYLKAFTVGLLGMGAIHFANHTDAGGMLVPLFWIGQMVYTVQEARRMRRKGIVEEEPEPPARRRPEKDSPLWGAILIGVGVLFLLDQFEMLDFGYIFERFWPVLIIVLGAQILIRSRRDSSSALS